jgi:hypothetical protein
VPRIDRFSGGQLEKKHMFEGGFHKIGSARWESHIEKRGALTRFLRATPSHDFFFLPMKAYVPRRLSSHCQPPPPPHLLLLHDGLHGSAPSSTACNLASPSTRRRSLAPPPPPTSSTAAVMSLHQTSNPNTDTRC